MLLFVKRLTIDAVNLATGLFVDAEANQLPDDVISTFLYFYVCRSLGDYL